MSPVEWIKGLFSERSLLVRAFRWLGSPWAQAKRIATLEAEVSALTRRTATWEAKNPSGAELYLGARWAYIPREGRNAAFCETCFQERDGELHLLSEGLVEGGALFLACTRAPSLHRFRASAERYRWGVETMNLRGA